MISTLTHPTSLHPADELASFMERIYRYRMMTTSGGNLSIRDIENAIWITPARADKGSLSRNDMVYVGPDGLAQGRHRPSSEYPFHEWIYSARPDIRAIVHAHPVALVAFSICGQRPDTRAFYRSYKVCGEVGYARYASPGSVELGHNVAAEFARGHNCVMLENHGVVVGGANLLEAFERFETLEFTARIILKAKALGGDIKYLTPSQFDLVKTKKQAFATFTPPTASPHEESVRQELSGFIQRGYRQRLLTAAQGSFSARIDAKRFVVTPVEVDRATIKPEELMLVEDRRMEKGKLASRLLPLHAAIYREHPEIQSIVVATPPNATAFSITHQAFDSRTIPESYIFLRDILNIPFGAVYGGGTEVAEAVSSFSPTAVLENSGVLVVGKSILEAYDRLEVLESTADTLINALTLGSLHPIAPEAVAELQKQFFA